MAYPRRKPHRLNGYDYSRTGCYYITICTYKRQKLFGDYLDSRRGDPVWSPVSPCTDDLSVSEHLNLQGSVISTDRIPIFTHPKTDKMIVRLNDAAKLPEQWLLEIRNKFHDIFVSDYAIMPDHIHFILINTSSGVATGDHTGSPLPDVIGWFKTMTANEYIRNVKTSNYTPFEKHVWQRDYYDHIIRNEHDYITTSNYILNNPYIRYHSDN